MISLRKYVTEFIGTFFLVLTIGLVVREGKTSAPNIIGPLAIGSVLMAMVYMGGHISGAHYNPAVSLAALCARELAPAQFIPYVICQLAGAFAASAAVYWLLNITHPVHVPPETTTGRALFAEFLFTFALALVILNVATAPKTAGNSFYGLAIGFTVLGGAICVGGISGGAFNPAVGTGPTLVDYLHGGHAETLKHLWIYWVGPLSGGLVAGVVANFQNDIPASAAS